MCPQRFAGIGLQGPFEVSAPLAEIHKGTWRKRAAGHFRSGHNFNFLSSLIEKSGFKIIRISFIDTRDICNLNYYRFNKYVQLLSYPIFKQLVKISDMFPGSRPNMSVFLATK